MVALMLTFSSTDGRAQDNSSVPPKQTQTPPPASAPRLVVQPQITDLSYYKIICDKPKDHDAADLCEQRRMAQAAEDSVWWARLQTWIGIFGAGGLAITLIFTALATKVASRQVKLSRRALVDTDRAFIFPDAGLLKAILRATDDKVQAWKTSVRWKNSGNTPTRYLHMYINKEIRADLLPPDFGFPDYGDGITTQSMIAPKAELESAELEITLEEMEAVSDGKKHLYVWG